MSGRPVNPDRQNAIDLGLMTYTGVPHKRCGTNIRYVSGGGCVHCARIIATEQREARKYLLQHPVNDAEPEPEVELDSAEDDGLDARYQEPETEAEANARFEESIEELM